MRQWQAPCTDQLAEISLDAGHANDIVYLPLDWVAKHRQRQSTGQWLPR